MGCKGIGKLAGFGIADTVEVETPSGGETTRFRMGSSRPPPTRGFGQAQRRTSPQNQAGRHLSGRGCPPDAGRPHLPRIPDPDSGPTRGFATPRRRSQAPHRLGQTAAWVRRWTSIVYTRVRDRRV